MLSDVALCLVEISLNLNVGEPRFRRAHSPPHFASMLLYICLGSAILQLLGNTCIYCVGPPQVFVNTLGLLLTKATVNSNPFPREGDTTAP